MAEEHEKIKSELKIVAAFISDTGIKLKPSNLNGAVIDFFRGKNYENLIDNRRQLPSSSTS
jgi:hypothetical protein